MKFYTQTSPLRQAAFATQRSATQAGCLAHSRILQLSQQQWNYLTYKNRQLSHKGTHIQACYQWFSISQNIHYTTCAALIAAPGFSSQPIAAVKQLLLWKVDKLAFFYEMGSLHSTSRRKGPAWMAYPVTFLLHGCYSSGSEPVYVAWILRALFDNITASFCFLCKSHLGQLLIAPSTTSVLTYSWCLWHALESLNFFIFVLKDCSSKIEFFNVLKFKLYLDTCCKK